ncbi:hypothetical protein ACKLNR_014179 [Fusarium oxysporum f. sp. zingiberi]
MAPIYADHPFPIIPTPGHKEAAPDMFSRVASEMALIHNMIIRGLNSIYLQAPRISPADIRSFLMYTLAWHTLLDMHHSCEEADFFPFIEGASGKKGLMNNNVEQHKAFQVEVEVFKTYVEDCMTGKQSFDGDKVVEMIDGFGETLTNHLRDEIPTLLKLRDYGMEKMRDLEKKFQGEGEESMKKLGLEKGLPFCFGNHDVDFEGGRWSSWPAAPWLVHILARHVTYWFHTDQWKFASCDQHGKLRPLYAFLQEKA